MRTAGVVLILASVAIRALVWYSSGPYFSLVIILLALFGILLFSEPPLERWLVEGNGKHQRLFQAAYLFLQMCLVMGLMLIPPLNDFPALLFIPLSLQAVMFYQHRSGFVWIAFFTLAMAAILIRGGQMVVQGLVMGLLFGGICFLAGSYAHMIRKAESARRENQQMFDELKLAHDRLKTYTAQRQELLAQIERAHLARELHDSVTQTVFSMNLSAQTARHLWPQDPIHLNAQFDRFLELANSASREIQTLVAHLSPPVVTGKGLVAAIEQLVAERRTLDRLEVQIEVYGETDLPGYVNTGLYRIVQEALTNIAKHARTHQATITLNWAGNPIYVEVEDQGIGFDSAASQNQPGHIGISEMIERADEIGWEFSIDTQPGSGTRIRVEKHRDGI